MISGRKYEDVMDTKNAYKMKSRLGEKHDQASQEATKAYAMYYHKDIVDILDQIKRELLLVFKTIIKCWRCINLFKIGVKT